ncbi:unnamed protein product [Clavelina lepadiformis]|uniref:BHLH domain-containing protein n=1 Tax=Clavelina lepadiformis TaxID=159417 RepID=A0ABP0G3J7_CLALP
MEINRDVLIMTTQTRAVEAKSESRKLPEIKFKYDATNQELSIGTIFVESAVKFCPNKQDHCDAKEKTYYELDPVSWDRKQHCQLFGDWGCDIEKDFLKSISNDDYLNTLTSALQATTSDGDFPKVTSSQPCNFRDYYGGIGLLHATSKVTSPLVGAQRQQSKERRISKRSQKYKQKYSKIDDTSKTSASVRERRRIQNINSAFENLRQSVPRFPYEKKMSKIDTLRLAIAYIALLKDILESGQMPWTYVRQCLDGFRDLHPDWITSGLSARLPWIGWYSDITSTRPTNSIPFSNIFNLIGDRR